MAARENVMRKVQALLDKAASTEFDGERDALMAKADELMARHAIEEFELQMLRPANERTKPLLKTINVVGTSVQWETTTTLVKLFRALASHCGVLIGRIGYEIGEGYVARVVGYPSDVDYLQVLYVNVQMHIISRIEPKADPAKSDLDNFIFLRECGVSNERIFALCGWEKWELNDKGFPTGACASRYGKLRKGYHAQCAAEGRPAMKKATNSTYRKSFVRGYVTRIEDRLADMARAREGIGTGHELVLANREDDLYAQFFAEFPDRAPHPDDCDCDRCHYYRCQDQKCKRPMCVEGRKPVRYRAPKEDKIDSMAWRVGRENANDADLSSGKMGTGKAGAIEA